MTGPNLQVPSAVLAGTYPETRAAAAALYRSLQDAQGRSEGITFAAPLALDVGGGNGLYHSVLQALCGGRVVTIEPSEEAFTKGLEHGVLQRTDIFHGTIQDWAPQHQGEAGAVFACNVAPRAVLEPGFAEALGAATMHGGLVVVTYREFPTAQQFSSVAGRGGRAAPIGPKPGCRHPPYGRRS